MKPDLLLRADASAAIGTGHVMRCLALAQAWQDAGGRATFACAELPPGLASRLTREMIERRGVEAAVGSDADAALTVCLARELGAAWVVVDGYRFGPDYYAALQAAGVNVMAIDDMAHLERYPVNLLLNQNLSAAAALYQDRIGAETELLLGPRYSLLRREFRQARVHRPDRAGRRRRLLLSFGGGDDIDLTGRVLRRLAETGLAGWEVLALAGAANPHVTALRTLAEAAPFPCELRIDVADVAEVMLWADAAITAGGSTVWELASLRLPALIGAAEDNQIAGMKALQAIPFFRVHHAEELLRLDLPAELERLLGAGAGRDFAIDALGASRVAQALSRRLAAA